MHVSELTIGSASDIKSALKKIDATGEKILFVVDNDDKLLGTLSDGDIRRQLLKSPNFSESITSCYNPKPVVLLEGYKESKAREIMLSTKKEIIPIVDKDDKLVSYVTWNRIFDYASTIKSKVEVPVVIMAGGKGTRLDPFTKILPKPLIPIGDKPIVEIIMDRFSDYGINDFYLTVNYKGEMIVSYFENVDLDYNLHYVWEKDFQGTAGSLSLLPKEMSETFIVTNCDIIVETDYSDLVKHHKKSGKLITVVGAVKHYGIPYGILNYQEGGKLLSISEKPEFDMVINTGLYILERKALKRIPKDCVYHMTDLINDLLADGESVGIYITSEKSYVDIGQWEEYRKNMDHLI